LPVPARAGATEAIDFLSTGVVTGDPLGPPDIGSRGVLFENDDGKHFLLLIDGHAVNDPLYGAATFDEGAGVPMDMVDHIEVIVGPGSVLYGSNAMMGVINVITKTAARYLGGHVTGDYEPGRTLHASAGVGVSFKLGRAPSEITAGVEYTQRFGPTLNFPYQDFRGSGGGTTAPPATGAPAGSSPSGPGSFGSSEPADGIWGGTVRSAYYAQIPTGLVRFRSGDFEVNVMASLDRRGIPYATSQDPVAFDDKESYSLSRALRIDARHQATLSTLVQLASRVYADSYDRHRRLDVPSAICNRAAAGCEYDDRGVARWVGIEERLSLNWLGDQSLVTLVGLDARERWVSAKEDILNPATGQYIGSTAGHIDANSLLVAPYVQQTYSPAGWLDLNAGVRVDADSRFAAVASPRAAVALRPWEKTTLKVIYAQAFRTPTWAETDLANYQIAPSDGVRPEKVRSIEGSIEQRVATHRFALGAFRSWWDDLIESTTLSDAERTRLQVAGQLPLLVGNLTQYRNVASVDNYGCTGSLEGGFAGDTVTYGASVTGAFTRLNEGGGSSTLAAAPQVFGNAHIAYKADGYWPSPSLAVSVLGPRQVDRTSASGAALPAAPAVADLRATLTGAVPGLKGLSYRASADYVTADRSPYSAGPDLNYTTKLAGGALGSSSLPPPGFAPIDQFRVFFGLRYDFAGEPQEAR
jgi:outer membrane receptor protein involved in Fe transport